MKKTVFVLLFLLAVSMLSGTAYAKPDGEYKAALKSYNSGKYKDAVLHLKGYISQKPDPAAYYLMGYSLYKLKRFDEASEYFMEAYLINPTFTPVKTAADDEATGKPGKKVVKTKNEPATDTVPADSDQKPVEVKKTEPVKAETAVTAPSSAEPAKPGPPPPKPEVQKAGPPGTVGPAKPQVPSPQTTVPMPQLPKPKQSMPEGAAIALPMLAGGLFAGFALVFFGIVLAFYVFFSLCMYLIARKLNVPAAWTAWVPLLNLWAVVGSAGKPWWWILLMFVPILGFFVWIYLWMCIVENLGKNKWLGLLVIVPIVGMIYMAILAFSKDNAPEHPTLEDKAPAHSTEEFD